MPKVVLIGFMGAGKSTVARALASRLQLPAVELDTQIVQYSGRDSIPAIFQHDGEAHFRTLETDVARSWQGEHRVVLSTGGGIVERAENLEYLRRHRGVIVYLQTDFVTVHERLQGDASRPLFADPEQAQALYQRRLALYQQAADVTVVTDGREPDEIAAEIEAQLSPALPAISSRTKVCMIFGDPVEHSLSPAMHNAGYRALGIDGQFVFVAARVSALQLKEAMAGVRAMGLRGVSCTIPHKTAVLPLLDEIDPVAERMGAVNTVVQEEGRLKGYNTDWLGIVRPIEQRTTLQGKRVAVLGAGGAARAAVFGVQERGASVVVINRTAAKAQALAAEVGGEGYGLEHIGRVRECDVIVQTTSVGMSPHIDDTLVPVACIRPGHVVMDAVYTPWHTRLLDDAVAQGATVIPGAEMFLHQGLAQFSLYTGLDGPVEVMEDIVARALGGNFSDV